MGLFDSFLDPQQAGLFGVAQGLLQAGGPQRVPMGFAGALGQGLSGGLEAAKAAAAFKQQQAMQAMNQQLMGAHITSLASEDAHRKALEAETQRKAAEQATNEQALQDAHKFAAGPEPTQVASNGVPADVTAPPIDVAAQRANLAADPGYHERRAQYLYSKGQFKLGDEAAKQAMSIRKEVQGIEQGKAPKTQMVAVNDKQEQLFAFNPKTNNFDIPMGQPRPIFNPNPLVNSTIENYPPPTPVMVPGTGEQKLVQFGKKGDIRETPYAPANSGLTAEAAGKVSMQKQAITDLDTVESKLFKDGKLDKTLVAAINIPGMAGMPGYTDARNTYSAIRNAVAAKLRIETGAQANASEIDDIMKRFMPTMGDTDQSARDKLSRLKQTFVDALAITKGLSHGGSSSASGADKSSLKKKYGLE